MKSSERKISQCILPFIHFCSLFIKSSEDFSASLKGIKFLRIIFFQNWNSSASSLFKSFKIFTSSWKLHQVLLETCNVLRLSTFSVLLGFSFESLIDNNKLTALNYLKFSIQQTKSSGRCLFVVNVIHYGIT